MYPRAPNRTVTVDVDGRVKIRQIASRDQDETISPLKSNSPSVTKA